MTHRDDPRANEVRTPLFNESPPKLNSADPNERNVEQRSDGASPVWEPTNLASAWGAMLGRIATEIPNRLKSKQFYEAINDMARFVAQYEDEHVSRRERATPEPLACEVCGEEDSDERVYGKVEVCRLCLSSAEYRVEQLTDILQRFIDGGRLESLLLQCENAGIQRTAKAIDPSGGSPK